METNGARLEEWSQRIAEHGGRVTRPRRVVMQVLLEAETPLSPQEICTRARRRYPSLGLVTVYRTLDVLETLAVVRRVHREDGCHAYLPATPGHHHLLLCRRCGRAMEFSGWDALDGLIAELEAATGYRVEEHLLQLIGLCPRCYAQLKEGERG